MDPSDIDTIEQVADAFEQLKEGVHGTVRDAIRQFGVRDDKVAIGPGVHLLDAHPGKGQQLDWVFIPGLEEKHLPDRRNVAGVALAEEHRVLLVMLSRAQYGVVVTYSKKLNGRFGPYNSTVSRWWNGLASAARMDAKGRQPGLSRPSVGSPGCR